MPVVPADVRPDFLRRQVLMSRNVTAGTLVRFFMGGLQNQIEHHHFPNMPRPALARARPVVLDYCRRHGIGYTQATLGQAYGSVVRHLNTMGRQDPDPFICPWSPSPVDAPSHGRTLDASLRTSVTGRRDRVSHAHRDRPLRGP